MKDFFVIASDFKRKKYSGGWKNGRHSTGEIGGEEEGYWKSDHFFQKISRFLVTARKKFLRKALYELREEIRQLYILRKNVFCNLGRVTLISWNIKYDEYNLPYSRKRRKCLPKFFYFKSNILVIATFNYEEPTNLECCYK